MFTIAGGILIAGAVLYGAPLLVIGIFNRAIRTTKAAAPPSVGKPLESSSYWPS